MEYGYEKRDYRGNLVYPMHPVQEEDDDNVTAAFTDGRKEMLKLSSLNQ